MVGGGDPFYLKFRINRPPLGLRKAKLPFIAQSCRAFIGLNIHAKIIVGGHPLLPEMLGQTNRVGAKSPDFRSVFARSASAVTSSKKVQLSLIGSPLRPFQ